MVKKSVPMEVKNLSKNIQAFFEAEAALKDVVKGDKPTSNQARILDFLYANKDRDVFQKDIEEFLQITPATCSGTLKLMEQKGYIERVSVEKDARLKKIQITQKVAEIQELVIADITRIDAALLEGVSQKDLEIFFKVIDQINKNTCR